MSMWLAYENQRRIDALDIRLSNLPIKHKVLTGLYRSDANLSIAHNLDIGEIIAVSVVFRQIKSGQLIALWRDDAKCQITDTDIILSAGLTEQDNRQVSVLLTYTDIVIDYPAIDDSKPSEPPPPTTYPDYTGLGVSNEYNRLINASPTLVNDINAIKANGWIFKRNYDNDGSFASTSSKEIFVGNKSANYPQNFFNTVAHETAHAMYNEPVDDSSRNAFIDSYLTDEGHSQIYNIKVADEAEANLGITIGWTYLNRFLPAYEQHGFTHKAFYDAGQIVGDEFTTSNTGENYRVYYGNFYDRVYG